MKKILLIAILLLSVVSKYSHAQVLYDDWPASNSGDMQLQYGFIGPPWGHTNLTYYIDNTAQAL
jgi:hypothetical protein